MARTTRKKETRIEGEARDVRRSRNANETVEKREVEESVLAEAEKYRVRPRWTGGDDGEIFRP